MMIILGATSIHAWEHRELAPLTHTCPTGDPRDCEGADESCVLCHFSIPTLMPQVGLCLIAFVALLIARLLMPALGLRVYKPVDRYSLTAPPMPCIASTCRVQTDRERSAPYA